MMCSLEPVTRSHHDALDEALISRRHNSDKQRHDSTYTYAMRYPLTLQRRMQQTGDGSGMTNPDGQRRLVESENMRYLCLSCSFVGVSKTKCK